MIACGCVCVRVRKHSGVAVCVQVLFNISGTQANPVKGVTLSGLNFRDTAYTYMDPHGMPSGGCACVPVCL